MGRCLSVKGRMGRCLSVKGRMGRCLSVKGRMERCISVKGCYGKVYTCQGGVWEGVYLRRCFIRKVYICVVWELVYACEGVA